jgi:DNA-binding CsgD family transcriptional regulator
MTKSTPIAETLLDAIYEGPLESLPWQSFLRELKVVTRAETALVLRWPHGPDLGLIIHTGEDGAALDLFREQFSAQSPFYNLPIGEPKTYREMLSGHDAEGCPYYRSFLSPMGVRDMMGLDLRIEDGVYARLRLIRYEGSERFGDDERQLLDKLKPYFTRALRLHSEIARKRSERDAVDQAIDKISIGMILLDGKGRPLFTNEFAKQTLHQREIADLFNDRLIFRDPRANDIIRKMLAQPSPHVDSRPMSGTVIQLKGNNERYSISALIFPVSCDLTSDTECFPSVSIMIKASQASPSISVQSIKELFGLTESEATISLFIAKGNSLTDAARKMGIARTTARTHLYSSFSKTYARRQSELVSLIHNAANSIWL